MSELFLDTEVRWSVPFIARLCVESGCDAEVLERVFWVEVFPEAIGNLTQVAGAWAGLALDEKALVKRANEDKVPWLLRRATGWMVEKEWLAVREVTKWLRTRPELEPALNAVGRAFFGSEVAPLEVDAALLEEARRMYEPLCQSMLMKDEVV